MATNTDSRIWIVGRLDVPNKISENTGEPLWYEVHMLAPKTITVEECVERVKNYWAGVEEMKGAKLVNRPVNVTKHTKLNFVNNSCF